MDFPAISEKKKKTLKTKTTMINFLVKAVKYEIKRILLQKHKEKEKPLQSNKVNLPILTFKERTKKGSDEDKTFSCNSNAEAVKVTQTHTHTRPLQNKQVLFGKRFSSALYSNDRRTIIITRKEDYPGRHFRSL